MQHYWDKDILCHTIFRAEDMATIPETGGRADISPDYEYIQVALTRWPEGRKCVAHKHLQQERKVIGTQEVWLVMAGRIKVFLFGLTHKLLATAELGIGDGLIIYRGGHQYEAIDGPVTLYEFKQGPYFGVKQDKELIPEPEEV